MLKVALKRYLAVAVILGMVFSCVNFSVYADEGQDQVAQTQELYKSSFDEILKRNGIKPERYKDIDFSKGIRGFEPNMFSSFDEYLLKFEDMLKKRGKSFLERFRYEQLRGEGIASNDVSTYNNTNPEKRNEVVRENDNRFIVKYKDSLASEKVNKALKPKIEKSVKVKKNNSSKNEPKNNLSKKDNLEVIKFNQKVSLEELKQELESANLYSEIEYIQPDYEIKHSATSNDINDQWGLFNTNQVSTEVSIDVDAASAWSLSEGTGVLVAVIDSGIDITHEGLVNSIWTNEDELPGNGIDDDGNGFADDTNGWNFYDNNNSVHNFNNAGDEIHGTHVAGIIAAQKVNANGIIGVAPKATILPVKAFENGSAYTSQVIEAISYAESMGAKVVNCSFGLSQNNQALKEAMAGSSMLFVCAAGNGGTNNDNSPVYPASYNLTNVISVAAINNDGNLASFSNYGVNTVHVAAPGQSIRSTVPGNAYDLQSGTSMSAPFVSGQAALICAKFSDFNAQQTKNQIIHSSDRLSTLEGKILGGNKVNCINSLQSVVSVETSRAIYQIQVPESNNNDVINTLSSGDVKQISSGPMHTLLLMNNGTIYAWGSNYYGQIGDGSYGNVRYSPRKINFDNLLQDEMIVEVAAGFDHSIARSNKNRVFEWGYNYFKEAGESSVKIITKPNVVEALTGISLKSISAGYGFNLALTSDGTSVYAWGINDRGQLGNETYINTKTPTQVKFPAGTIISQIAAGGDHGMALIDDKVYTWGDNGAGQLGNNNSSVSNSFIPVLANLNDTIQIVSISAGSYHNLVLTNDNKVYAWGLNTDGQLGDYVYDENECYIDVIYTPILSKMPNNFIVKSIQAGYNCSNILSNDGIFCPLGQTSVSYWITNFKISLITSGFYYNLLVSDAGEIYGFGDNYSGELGLGDQSIFYVHWSEKKSIKLPKTMNINAVKDRDINWNITASNASMYGYFYITYDPNKLSVLDFNFSAEYIWVTNEPTSGIISFHVVDYGKYTGIFGDITFQAKDTSNTYIDVISYRQYY